MVESSNDVISHGDSSDVTSWLLNFLLVRRISAIVLNPLQVFQVVTVWLDRWLLQDLRSCLRLLPMSVCFRILIGSLNVVLFGLVVDNFA